MAKCIPNYKDAVWSYYRYEPSLAGAIIFCLLFGFASGIHAFQMYTTRTWYLTALVIGGLCKLRIRDIQSIIFFFPSCSNGSSCAGEFIGYIARAINATEEPGCWGLGPYVVQNVLVLIAPAFMAASIYMILGRIILLTDGDSHSLIRRRWITKIFVTGDVVSLLMQSSGIYRPEPLRR